MTGIKRTSKRAVEASPVETAREDQPRIFISLVDVLTERLRPRRRPQDRNEPECSHQELKALAALGDQDTLTMSDLAGILSVPLSTATHTIDKLVGKGLVERRRVQQDRRVVQVTFSKKGKRINQFVLESRRAMGKELLETLTPRDREVFLQRLAAVTRAAIATDSR